MKSLQFIVAFFLIFTSVLITSCETEPIDSDLLAQLENGGGTDGGDGDGGTDGGGTGGGTGGGGTATGVFKVDFDGKTFTANIVQALVNDGLIAISGLKMPSGELVQITLPAPYNKVGTYTWKSVASSGGIIGLAYITSNGTEPFTGDEKGTGGASDFSGYTDTASITISKIDVANKKISGTFQFTGVKFKDLTETSIETKVFTNGSFTDIPFTTDNSVIDTDTFYAKLDGTEFVENGIDVASVDSSGVNPYYSIVAKKTNGDSIGLRIRQSLAVGTYQFAGAFGPQINASCLLGGLIFIGDTGSITITSKTSTQMKGTFNVVITNFTSGSTKTISAGTFSVDLP